MTNKLCVRMNSVLLLLSLSLLQFHFSDRTFEQLLINDSDSLPKVL
jgi:hypothetical protein